MFARCIVSILTKSESLAQICAKNTEMQNFFLWDCFLLVRPVHAKILQMNLVNFTNLFQHITLPTEVFRVLSKTDENYKLFDKCIFNTISQLVLLVSL